MPRIEFDHPEIDAWIEEGNSGSETIDLCIRCAKKHKTAKTMKYVPKDGGIGGMGDPIPKDSKIIILGRDLWLDEQDYTCDECGKLLTENNY